MAMQRYTVLEFVNITFFGKGNQIIADMITLSISR